MIALLPAWIIGAPLLLGIVDWLRTPKPDTSRDGTTSPAAQSPRRL